MEEEKRLFLQKQLSDFRESAEESLRFPSTLTALERKFIHRVGTELNLVSKSAGAGENRYISIWKRESDEAPVSTKDSAENAVINFQLNPRLRSLLSGPEIISAIEILQTQQQQVADAKNSSIAKKSRRFVSNNDRLRASYQNAESARRNHSNFTHLQAKRASLPAAEYRQAVVELVKTHQIVLISGETGCGKSTQIPQFLLEDPELGPTLRMVITQPRRISAISLAERIAYERSETVGGMIGYNIRLESQYNLQTQTQTQVLFVTPGVLLRKLLDDPDLNEYSLVIVDEAHERDRFTEFLLIVLRDICMRRNSTLKLILMSATMHTAKLRSYFGDIPQINVGGSVHPVSEFFLEHVLKFIHYNPAATAASASNQQQEKSSLMSYQNRVFKCVICGKSPFLSAEEVGTHAATCFPSQAVDYSFIPDSTSNKAQRLQHFQMKMKNMSKYFQSQYSATQSRLLSAHQPKNAKGETATAAYNNETAAEEVEADTEDFEEDENSDFELDDIDIVPTLPTPEQGQGTSNNPSDRFLRSEENTELNLLLKLYQQELENSNGAQQQQSKDIDDMLIVRLLQFIVSSEFGSSSILSSTAAGADSVGGGGILIFLPGWEDISRLHRLLTTQQASSQQGQVNFCDPDKFLVLQLHSGVPKREQLLVFNPCPLAHKGQRKIVLSTNIAETSVTIDDVSVVIDCGLAKEKCYDPHTKLSFLKGMFISQAAARQRKGRAGRTQVGVCFRLYSALRASHLRDFQDSELLRMPLDEVVLQAKALGLANGRSGASNGGEGAKEFLQKALDPPPELSIQHAIDLLTSLNCLDSQEALTDLGQAIAMLPMSPRLGKMLLYGCLLGVGPSTVKLGAVMSCRDPFLMSTTEMQRMKVNKAKMELTGHSLSDQVVVLKAMELFGAALQQRGNQEAKQLCDHYDLSFPTMITLLDTATQLDRSLKDVNIISTQTRLLRNNGNLALTALSLASGLYPDIAIRAGQQTYFTTEKGAKTKIHPSSVNARVAKYKNNTAKDQIDILTFQDLIFLNPHLKNARIGGASYLMLGTTAMSLVGLMLLSGDVAFVSDEEVVIDQWIHVRINSADQQLIRQGRQLLQLAMLAFVRSPDNIQQQQAIPKAIDKVTSVLGEAQAELYTVGRNSFAVTKESKDMKEIKEKRSSEGKKK